MRTIRKVCRWIHREFGYFTVGLTLVYGISGLAVNHAHHWDANYSHETAEHTIEPPGTGPTTEVAPLVLERLSPERPVKTTWRAAPDQLDVFVEGGAYHVNLETGAVLEKRTAKRPWLYEMNFMHLNNGRGIWTVLADGYAGILILLAITGIFLTKGRRGLVGRGGVLMVLGIILPIVYAIWMR